MCTRAKCYLHPVLASLQTTDGSTLVQCRSLRHSVDMKWRLNQRQFRLWAHLGQQHPIFSCILKGGKARPHDSKAVRRTRRGTQQQKYVALGRNHQLRRHAIGEMPQLPHHTRCVMTQSIISNECLVPCARSEVRPATTDCLADRETLI